MAIHPILKGIYISLSVFTVAIQAAVLIMVWTMPNLPGTVIRDQLCLPVSERSQTLECDLTETRLSGYLQKKLKHLDKQLEEDERKSVDRLKADNAVALKNFRKSAKPDRKPSARFVGKDIVETTDDSADMTPVRNWRCGKENIDFGGFSRYGIEYKDGRVIVPLTGLYFVYSLLDMYEPCDRTTGVPQIKLLNSTVRHSIYRYNVKHGEEEEIVSTSIPHQLSKYFQYNYYSSYVSTVYTFVAGDELVVKISNATYLNYSPEKNYFGVSMI